MRKSSLRINIDEIPTPNFNKDKTYWFRRKEPFSSHKIFLRCFCSECDKEMEVIKSAIYQKAKKENISILNLIPICWNCCQKKKITDYNKSAKGRLASSRNGKISGSKNYPKLLSHIQNHCHEWLSGKNNYNWKGGTRICTCGRKKSFRAGTCKKCQGNYFGSSWKTIEVIPNVFVKLQGYEPQTLRFLLNLN
jgi:hypothetical protein